MKQPAIKLAIGDGIEGSLVVTGCFERSTPDLHRLTRRLGGTVERAIEQPGWKAKSRQVCRASTRAREAIMVEVHGLGTETDFDTDNLCDWIATVVETAQQEGRPELFLVLPSHRAGRGRNSLQVMQRLLLCGYKYDRYKRRTSRPGVRAIWVVPPAGEEDSYGQALRLARPISRAVRWCRDLGNTPPNDANPEWMAQQAKALADKEGLECWVLEEEELEDLGMGGILAVGQGSANRPLLVKLEGGAGDEVVSFVGKGVTFDTGGISIKPSSGMEEMKYDKAGACTVLGIVQALAQLDLPVRFRAYLPLVENMPGGGSYRPGDIIRCYNGKTVEILDTDAEGRVILADSLAWAAEERPDSLLEYSTLTGASVVALGHHGAALYSPDDLLATELLSASMSSGEKLWRMPLWREFGKEMKGAHADLRNLGSRWGGANSAAAFLANFVGRVNRWAHLDIAGPAYRASREAGISGATGFGVGLTIDWLLSKTGTF